MLRGVLKNKGWNKVFRLFQTRLEVQISDAQGHPVAPDSYLKYPWKILLRVCQMGLDT